MFSDTSRTTRLRRLRSRYSIQPVTANSGIAKLVSMNSTTPPVPKKLPRCSANMLAPICCRQLPSS